MFDLGFSELFLIGVIALLVLGPERLPKAARTVGALLRRARSSYMSLKSDIERELAADELKRSIKSVTDPVRSVREAASEVGAAGREFEAELRQVDRRNASAEVDSALGVSKPVESAPVAGGASEPARVADDPEPALDVPAHAPESTGAADSSGLRKHSSTDDGHLTATERETGGPDTNGNRS